MNPKPEGQITRVLIQKLLIKKSQKNTKRTKAEKLLPTGQRFIPTVDVPWFSLLASVQIGLLGRRTEQEGAEEAEKPKTVALLLFIEPVEQMESHQKIGDSYNSSFRNFLR